MATIPYIQSNSVGLCQSSRNLNNCSRICMLSGTKMLINVTTGSGHWTLTLSLFTHAAFITSIFILMFHLLLSETLMSTYKSTWLHNPEQQKYHQSHENLESQIICSSSTTWSLYNENRCFSCHKCATRSR